MTQRFLSNEENSLFKFNNEDSKQLTICNGDQALQSSINAALSIYSILKTSLGPRSMSKLIIKNNGQYIISNDGATILSNIEVQHPAAVILVNIALSQDREIGDGTTSIVLLAGEILKSLTQLYFRSKEQHIPIHQTTITNILYQLLNEINKILDSQAIEYDRSSNSNENNSTLFKLAGVALGTKHYSYWTKNLTTMTIDAIQNILIKNKTPTTTPIIDIKNNIQICKLQGGNIDQSCFKNGLIITTKQMPVLKMSNGSDIRIKSIIIGYDINKHIQNSQSIHSSIKSTSEMNEYYRINDNLLLQLVHKLIDNQVLLVLFKYKIPEFLVQLLYSNNISVIQDFNNTTSEDDSNSGGITQDDIIINKLSKLTNSIPIMKYDELDFHLFQQKEEREEKTKQNDHHNDEFGCFGFISKIEIISKFDNDFYIYLNNDNSNFGSDNYNNKLSCIILRGPTKDILDDLEIGIIDSLHLIKSSLESTPMIVYGGGCCEISISIKLLEYSNSIDTDATSSSSSSGSCDRGLNYWKKEISKTLSDCFQIIPSILVMNAYNSSNNKSPLEIIAELSSLHLLHTKTSVDSCDKDRDDKNKDICSLGIDGWTGEIKDMKKIDVIEPLVLKKSIITTAIEAVITLLRIDTIVSSTSTN